MADLTRRSVLGVTGLAALGTGLSWDRLTGRDVPGRDGNALTVAILGTAADAASRQALLDAFREAHPDIPVRLQAVQGQDWTQFFTKILTMVAAGTPPDVCLIATEGAQLFADRLAHPLDEFVSRDAADLQDYFDDVHPSLVESFMYQGSLFMLPADFNAANVYYNAGALQRAGLERPADDWTVDDFVTVARAMRQGAGGSSFRPYFWTNRLWGGVVPWLYVHGTSFLRESRAGGGEWFWQKFYAGDPTASSRSGGYQWLEAGADDPAVLETFEFLRELTAEGLGSSPAQGGGNELVARFAEGVIGMTPAGGFWAQGLADGGMGPDDFDVTFFPAPGPSATSSGPPGTPSCARRSARTRRGSGSSSAPPDAAWNCPSPNPRRPPPGAPWWTRRSTPAPAEALVGVLRHPRPLPRHRPHPGTAAAGGRRDGAGQERPRRGDRTGRRRGARRPRHDAARPRARPAERIGELMATTVPTPTTDVRVGPAQAAGRRPETPRQRRARRLLVTLFLAPTVVGIALFTLVPIVASVLLAFFRWDVVTPPTFAGLDNFADIGADPTVRVAFLNTFVFVAVAVTLQLGVAMGLAVLVQSTMPGWLRSVFRSTLFFPLILSAASVSLVMAYLFNEDFGW